MGRFNNDRGFGGGRSGGGGGRRSERPEMFDAVCDNCGDRCKVPFQPTSGKPIYCSDCFESMGNGRGESRNDRGSSRDFRGSGGNEMFEAVCDDCGRDCQVPFRPTGEKPIYCSRCFEKRGNTHEGDEFSSSRGGGRDRSRSSGGGDNRTLENTMLLLNEKLDKIVSLLESQQVKAKVIVKKPKVEKEVKTVDEILSDIDETL